jgi:serine/threonine-protein kinase HipA
VPINGKERFGDVTREDVLAFSETLGIPNSLASKQLDRIASGIDGEFSNLYQQVEQLPPSVARPGELRMLRQVQFLVVKEMVKRLL